MGGFLDNSHKESTSVTLSPASAFPAKKNTYVLGLHCVYQLFVTKFCQANDGGGTWSYVNLGSEKSQELMPGDTEGCLRNDPQEVLVDVKHHNYLSPVSF